VTARPAAVLVVDDDPFMREITAELLRQLGIADIRLAGDGAEALAAMDRSGPFDMVLCDLDMAGMDGIQLLRHLSERDFDGAVTVISGAGADVLATAADLARLHGLRLAGALTKPISTTELSAALDTFPLSAPHAGATGGQALRQPLISPAELRRGLAAGSVEIHVQPKVTVVDRRVVGAEALLRWRGANGDVLPPASILPVAEEQGLVNDLTLAVFHQAVAALAEWRRAGLDLRISVNLSRDNLASLSLPDAMGEAVRAAGIDPSRITLEVSQTGVLEDISVGMEVVGRLRLKGFGISIDDYGLGYSSLGQLKNLPVTEIKVARSFVEGAEADDTLSEILGSSATLGRSLGLSVVAEGVETVEVLALLESLGCDEMQGYLVSRPMPVADLPGWKARWDRTWHVDSEGA
jgi:EAL domain-containing protein (putative c-di-GMP-specific phosphodiesterase class I)/ActR/RegA family two-component response regulator